MKGRTTRTILETLPDLADGYDVVIIAHPAVEAFRIAEEIVARAESFGIPAKLSEGNDDARLGDEPIVMIRPLGWEPMFRATWRAPAKVHIDHSARFEKPSFRPPSLRTVITKEIANG